MNDTTNPARRLRHGDRPTDPLRWNDRWTLLLTGPTMGLIGPYGSTWPNQSAAYERVNVILEGTVPKLEDVEQYRLQMAGISTAALGYWKEGDGINPEYDTVPLRDVARLYAKYEALHKAQPSGAARDVIAERRRQVEQEGYDHKHDDAYPGGQIAAYAAFYAMPPEVRELRADGYDFDTVGDAVCPLTWTPPKTGDRRRELVKAGALILAEIERMDRAAAQAAPDAVDAALTDAIVHGTGIYRMIIEGRIPVTVRITGFEMVDDSAERAEPRQVADMVRPDVTAADFVPPDIELTAEARRHYAELAAFPPKLQRDALYQDYAVPKRDADDGGKVE